MYTHLVLSWVLWQQDGGIGSKCITMPIPREHVTQCNGVPHLCVCNSVWKTMEVYGKNKFSIINIFFICMCLKCCGDSFAPLSRKVSQIQCKFRCRTKTVLFAFVVFANHSKEQIKLNLTTPLISFNTSHLTLIESQMQCEAREGEGGGVGAADESYLCLPQLSPCQPVQAVPLRFLNVRLRYRHTTCLIYWHDDFNQICCMSPSHGGRK